jgi:hypothetical protein
MSSAYVVVPTARRLIRYGSFLGHGWKRVTQQGAILNVMAGLCRLPRRTVPSALAAAAQLRAQSKEFNRGLPELVQHFRL